MPPGPRPVTLEVHRFASVAYRPDGRRSNQAVVAYACQSTAE
jgi:hypothetical protein